MSPKSFIRGLALTTVLQIMGCGGMAWAMPPVRGHTGFVAAVIITMICFCVTLYLIARVVARSPLTRSFIQLVMVTVFVKMLICLALIIGYEKGFAPTDNSFVWPFVWIYVTSTVFEVVFLEKTGRQQQNTKRS